MSQQLEYLTHEQIQQEELAILRNFKSFCEGKGLQFSLAGGTLLGAVRHKGFIPWDDDIDVCMPRPDYERFKVLFSELAAVTGYELQGYADVEVDPLFVKILNPAISVRDAADKKGAIGRLWIDVFPYDGLPNSKDAIRSIYERADKLRKIVWLRQTRWTFGGSLVTKVGKCVLGPIVSAFNLDKFCSGKLSTLAKACSYEDSEMVGCITWGMYGEGEAIPKKGYARTELLDFCGEQYPAMSCWNEYLSGIYDDYMQLPPVEKRVAHGLTAWRVD